MRIGQTSLIHFLSRATASGLAFLATVYFARILGAELLGIYFLILAVIAWLKLGGTMGVAQAVTKRVSEGADQDQYVVAGATMVLGLFFVTSLIILIFQSPLNEYIQFDGHQYVVLLLFASLTFIYATSILEGHHLVHIAAILNPIKISVRSIAQFAAVFAGFGLIGLLFGYAIGAIFAAVIGILVASPTIEPPNRHHFEQLFDYAKYSWLNSVQSQNFNWVDVTVLGFFVSSSLIGVYSIAWNIASFLAIFGFSISAAMFPEISRLSTREGHQRIGGLVEDALTFAGIILIPGLVGGWIIADRLLLIYGEEFVQGDQILLLLIFAYLLYSYQEQFLNALNGIDRPDVTFRINLIFIGANLALNVGLVYIYGWIGAAVATALSVAISGTAAYFALRNMIDFSVPVAEILKQWVAATMMGIAVISVRSVGETHWIGEYNEPFVVILVAVGAVFYFGILFGISRTFRLTVLRNLPVGQLQ